MSTAVVTGATGFVGSHLVDGLLERHYRVIAVVRRTSDLRWLERKPVQRLEADFSKDMPALPVCDILFHVAGVITASSRREYFEGNFEVVRRVAAAARTARFVHVSSLAAAGPGLDLHEDSPCRPISLYGESKRMGEREALYWGLRMPVTVIRPPVVYGTRDRALLDMYRTVACGLRPEIGGRKLVSVVHVRDLVNGIIRAAESAAGIDQVFFLANRIPCEVSDLMDAIQAALGCWTLRMRIPDRVVRFLGTTVGAAAELLGARTAFNRDKAVEMTQPAWTCTPEKARRLLGWEARTPVADGMAETIAWYRAKDLL